MKFTIRADFVALISVLFGLLPSGVNALEIEETCMMRFCVLEVEGLMTESSVSILEGAIRNSPSLDAIFLNSPGGNLLSGLEIGRIIRAGGINTIVSEGGQCLSACAYAFLGGVDRSVREGGQLGFHRFSVGEGHSSNSNINTTLSVAQNLSSEILSYVISMGVDARIFVHASNTPAEQMYVPDIETLKDYNILTPQYFESFFLDPFGNGIVAASQSIQNDTRFDNLTQITFYCRRSQPFLLLTSRVSPHSQSLTELTISTEGPRPTSVVVPAQQIDSRSNGGDSVYVSPIERGLVEAFGTAERLVVSLPLPFSDGGGLNYARDLDTRDRRYIDASLRICID